MPQRCRSFSKQAIFLLKHAKNNFFSPRLPRPLLHSTADFAPEWSYASKSNSFHSELRTFQSRFPISVRFSQCEAAQRKFIHKFSVPQKRRKEINHPLLVDVISLLGDKVVLHHGSSATASEEALANESSMQKLLELVDAVSPPMTAYPAAAVQRLPFFILDKRKTHRKVELELRTTGGDCKRMVEKRLQAFFAECGVPSVFQWEKDSWQLSEAVPIKTKPIDGSGDDRRVPETIKAEGSAEQPQRHGHGNEEAEADASKKETDGGIRSEEGHGGVAAPKSTSMGHEFEPCSSEPTDNEAHMAMHDVPPIGEVVRRLDRTLEAIGFVPWSEQGAYRARVAAAMEAMQDDGWMIADAAARIWAGEREFPKLVEGLDQGSAALVKNILYHTMRFEHLHGRRELGERSSQDERF